MARSVCATNLLKPRVGEQMVDGVTRGFRESEFAYPGPGSCESAPPPSPGPLATDAPGRAIETASRRRYTRSAGSTMTKAAGAFPVISIDEFSLSTARLSSATRFTCGSRAVGCTFIHPPGGLTLTRERS